MQYVTTCDILVDGDRHIAGDVLRTTAPGTIASMLRMNQIAPYVPPPVIPSAAPISESPKAEKPKHDKQKKADN